MGQFPGFSEEWTAKSNPTVLLFIRVFSSVHSVLTEAAQGRRQFTGPGSLTGLPSNHGPAKQSLPPRARFHGPQDYLSPLQPPPQAQSTISSPWHRIAVPVWARAVSFLPKRDDESTAHKGRRLCGPNRIGAPPNTVAQRLTRPTEKANRRDAKAHWATGSIGACNSTGAHSSL